MGNLHAGHIALVENAREHGRCVVVSIFVNRLQFEPGGDFDRYPRTLEARLREAAQQAHCDVVFAPDEREMYPATQEIVLSPPRVAHTLEGEHRAGHFQGVVTVVAKLLNIVRPHAAIFGKKDYQQLLVLRELVRQLNFGLEVVPGETVREPDGLAMSSRNGYLSADERREAVRLSRVLRSIHEAVAAGRRDFADLEKAAREELAAHGLASGLHRREAPGGAGPAGRGRPRAGRARRRLAGKDPPHRQPRDHRTMTQFPRVMLPLDGIRVVEFSHMVMGPTCGLVLADLGAEVIKVEPAGKGDRDALPHDSGAGFFAAFNRNKKSVQLDTDDARMASRTAEEAHRAPPTSSSRISAPARWRRRASATTR